MHSITDCFTSIIETQNKLKYPFPKFLCYSATTEEIQITEKSLDIIFNDELCELYSFANGTHIDTPAPLGLIGLLPIYQFLKLNNAVQYYGVHIGFEFSFLNEVKNYKPEKKLFPFLENSSGDCYWVDLNLNSQFYGKIYWTNTLGEEPDYHFNPLTNMFNVIKESYDTEVIFLDEDKYLDCNYTKFGQIARKYNPGIEYWNMYLKS